MLRGLRAALAVSLLVLAPRLGAAEEADDRETRGYIGFAATPNGILPDEDRAELGGLEGMVVQSVVPGMPGEAAGLARGDVLVSFNGTPVPDSKWLTKETKESEALKFWDAWKKITGAVKPGTDVTLVVRRAGKEVSITAKAVDYETQLKFRNLAEEEESYPKIPDPAGAGEAKASSFDFENVESDRPEGFLVFRGMWEVRGESGAAKPNQVLLQDSSVEPWAFCLATGKGLAARDGKVSVRFRPLSGSDDQTGGIVFRARDRKHYYLARANALEGNLRLYVVSGDSLEDRKQIASVEVKAPEKGKWHTLAVEFVGSALKATLDGKDSVTATDETYAGPGWSGLWTKADSVTEFDDLKLEPASTPGK
jgi:hypothetical protein